MTQKNSESLAFLGVAAITTLIWWICVQANTPPTSAPRAEEAYAVPGSTDRR